MQLSVGEAWSVRLTASFVLNIATRGDWTAQRFWSLDSRALFNCQLSSGKFSWALQPALPSLRSHGLENELHAMGSGHSYSSLVSMRAKGGNICMFRVHTPLQPSGWDLVTTATTTTTTATAIPSKSDCKVSLSDSQSRLSAQLCGSKFLLRALLGINRRVPPSSRQDNEELSSLVLAASTQTPVKNG